MRLRKKNPIDLMYSLELVPPGSTGKKSYLAEVVIKDVRLKNGLFRLVV
jgi:hypothetical protein